jgi:hypothetical protein
MSLFQDVEFPTFQVQLDMAQIPMQALQSPIVEASKAVTSSKLPDYFYVVDKASKSLCHNTEGWGPLSPSRYDFTPCTLDAIITVVVVLFGIVLGTSTIVYLRRNQPSQEVKRNWHFWAKMVSSTRVHNTC